MQCARCKAISRRQNTVSAPVVINSSVLIPQARAIFFGEEIGGVVSNTRSVTLSKSVSGTTLYETARMRALFIDLLATLAISNETYKTILF